MCLEQSEGIVGNKLEWRVGAISEDLLRKLNLTLDSRKPLNICLFLKQGGLEIAVYQHLSSLKICSLLFQ